MNSAILSGQWNDSHVRTAVLQLLKEMNQCTLAGLSPLSQPMISNILNSKFAGKMGADKCKEFGLWYVKYREDNKAAQEFEGWPKDTRLTFHPSEEIPKLRHWYQTWKNPSDAILNQLLEELNHGPVRKERAKVSLQKLKIWWKNEKQRLKRIQMQDPNVIRTKPKQRRMSTKQNSQRPEEVTSVQESDSEHSLLDISGPEAVSFVPTDPMFSSNLSSVPHQKADQHHSSSSTTTNTSSSPSTTSKLFTPSGLMNAIKLPDTLKAVTGPLKLSAENLDSCNKKAGKVTCHSVGGSPLNIAQPVSHDYSLHHSSSSTASMLSPERLDYRGYTHTSTTFPQTRPPQFITIQPAHMKGNTPLYTMEAPVSALHGPYYAQQRAAILDHKTNPQGLPVFPGPEINNRSPHSTPSPRPK